MVVRSMMTWRGKREDPHAKPGFSAAKPGFSAARDCLWHLSSVQARTSDSKRRSKWRMHPTCNPPQAEEQANPSHTPALAAPIDSVRAWAERRPAAPACRLDSMRHAINHSARTRIPLRAARQCDALQHQGLQTGNARQMKRRS